MKAIIPLLSPILVIALQIVACASARPPTTTHAAASAPTAALAAPLPTTSSTVLPPNPSCQFSGTLEAWGDLYWTADAATIGASLSAYSALQVSSLEISPDAKQRTKISVEMPFKGTVWLSPRAEILQLRHDIAMKRTGFYLQAHTPIVPVQLAEGKVKIQKDFWPALAPNRRPEPRSFNATIACSDLELASHASEGELEGELWRLPSGITPLHSDPASPPLGNLACDAYSCCVGVAETKGAWARVHMTSPFGFRGWVPKVGEKQCYGMIGFLDPDGIASHTANAEIPIFLTSSDSEPILKLEPGAQVILGDTFGEFISIRLVALRGSKFLIRKTSRSDLDQVKTGHSPPK